MSSNSSTRHLRTQKLQDFLHGFFEDGVNFGEKEINNHLLVKYRLPNSEETRVEIYSLPLLQPHRRFEMRERQHEL